MLFTHSTLQQQSIFRSTICRSWLNFPCSFRMSTHHNLFRTNSGLLAWKSNLRSKLKTFISIKTALIKANSLLTSLNALFHLESGKSQTHYSQQKFNSSSLQKLSQWTQKLLKTFSSSSIEQKQRKAWTEIKSSLTESQLKSNRRNGLLQVNLRTCSCLSTSWTIIRQILSQISYGNRLKLLFAINASVNSQQKKFHKMPYTKLSDCTHMNS